MYNEEVANELESKARWTLVSRETFYEQHRKLWDKSWKTVFLRESLDPEDTSWTGLIQYKVYVPYFKYLVKGENREFYINTKVINDEDGDKTSINKRA